MSHSFYLPDFGRFWESRDQPQPGSFLSPGSKREDPGNEVAIAKIPGEFFLTKMPAELTSTEQIFTKTSRLVPLFPCGNYNVTFRE